MSKLSFIEVKSELGAGTRGASLGVDAMKIAGLESGSDLFRDTPSVEVKTNNDLLFEPTITPYAKRIEGVLEVCDNVANAVAKSLKNDVFPIVLAGDHSTALGTIAGIKRENPKKRLGVVWIDAHVDIHSPYTTPTGNLHGMPISAALNEDNSENYLNKLNKESIDLWNKMKGLAGVSPMINYEDIVFISARDMEPEESYLLKKNNVKNFKTAEVKRKGVEKVARETIAYLKSCDLIYVSFDVDSMDSSISKGTGTPVRNGISEKEAGSLCVRLVQHEKVCCFEVTEVNPTLDNENKMAQNAFEILQRVVAQKI